MKVINKKTNEDVTSLYLQHMEGSISKEEFEKRAKVEAFKLNPVLV